MANNRQNGESNPNWRGGAHISWHGYKMIHQPDHPRANSGGYVFEQVLVAERILGKPLPSKSVVHHTIQTFNGRKNNKALVICQDQSYHQLLHQRSEALTISGHASWRRCSICKQFDAPINLYILGQIVCYHQSCKNEYARNRRSTNSLKKG